MHASGYKIVIVGHSLGAAVATLLSALLRCRISGLKCWAYGCPAICDAKLADTLRIQGIVTAVVRHDDVIPRFTPRTIRALMRNLVVFREKVFRFVEEDWGDVLVRAAELWSPRWRSAETEYVISKEELELQDENGCVRTSSSEPTAPEEDHPRASDVDDADDLIHVTDGKLADVWLPGRVLHLYTHRGLFQPSFVSRTFPGLRRIEVQGNIFEDHKAKSIFEALLEVCDTKPFLVLLRLSSLSPFLGGYAGKGC